MIIDVTNTIGRHKFKPEITAESLLEQMDKAGIDMAVIFCYAESLDNESVYNAIHKYPDRFIGLYTVNPWADNAAEELEDALQNKGFKGLYMNPIRHGYMLCEHQLTYPLLKVVEKYHGVVWCYGAAETFSLPVFFHDMCKDFPDVNFIMGRCGVSYDNATAVEILKRYPNIYTDTSSGMDFHALRAMRVGGTDKVMMGTGTPECNYFEIELKKVKNCVAHFPGEEDKVLYKNAARIFGLEVE